MVTKLNDKKTIRDSDNSLNNLKKTNKTGGNVGVKDILTSENPGNNSKFSLLYSDSYFRIVIVLHYLPAKIIILTVFEKNYSQVSRTRPLLVHDMLLMQDKVITCRSWSLVGKINKISPMLNCLINYIKILPYQLQLDKYKTKLFDFFSHATI